MERIYEHRKETVQLCNKARDIYTEEEFKKLQESNDYKQLNEWEQFRVDNAFITSNIPSIDYNKLTLDEKLDLLYENSSELKMLDEDIKRSLCPPIGSGYND